MGATMSSQFQSIHRSRPARHCTMPCARPSPEYFSTLQIPLLSGRFFTNDDRAGRPKTIIISHQLAQQYFPGENPLGKHLLVPSHGNADYEIVGVVGDTLSQVGQPGRPTMYMPVLNGESNRAG